jgi:hypothetical protein
MVVVMLSYHKVCTMRLGTTSVPAVFPVFVILDPVDNQCWRPAEELVAYFNQIPTGKSLEIHNGTFTFGIPPQRPEVLQAILQFNYQLHITLYRSLDNKFAHGQIPFTYEFHGGENCHFCSISSTYPHTTQPTSWPWNFASG